MIIFKKINPYNFIVLNVSILSLHHFKPIAKLNLNLISFGDRHESKITSFIMIDHYFTHDKSIELQFNKDKKFINTMYKLAVDSLN